MPPTEPYDVCLILEGTYPYVSGGVSTWVHNLIRALPEIRFCAVSIFPTPKETAEIKYELPDNFHLEHIAYIHEYNLESEGNKKRRERRRIVDTIVDFHQHIGEGEGDRFGAVVDLFQHLGKSGLTIRDLVHGKEAWSFLVDQYQGNQNTVSFIDYFWTYRFTHLPLFNLLRAPIPRARVYHTISTGFAGMLAAMAKHIYRRPMLLTEHGIYTKERKIEIAQAEWIYVADGERVRVQKDVNAFQKLWINMFEGLGRMAYNMADRIFTLYTGNRKLEIAEGADPHKIDIIPNGIDVERFKDLKPEVFDETEKTKKAFTVAFVGRVVAIKDVKTFVRACKIASLQMPGLIFLVLGPTDEDPDYYRECKDMVQLLRLEERLSFTGRIDVMEYYRKIDLLVLTSISEAQPLVILEANCAGIPVVASDVGSCRELIEGRTHNDRLIGPSGIVTPVADPAGTAKGIVSILSDPDQRMQMAAAGRRRVRKYYREKDLNRKYYNIYKHYMQQEDR
ncbi:GT4 family glycosyltransferase PelF [Breoghania sp.]|uniref:GT4 family glycosyltransferase PelF n=1 Tax=Breoghania sp. TaxID=2065378 RepID=UPI0029C69424|nr:GT4 family glycosyltransferase PelF [Breoghania sp.]